MARKKLARQKTVESGTLKRGRNSELIGQRNERLISRYHELTEVQRLRVDDVLRILSTEEFFISERRIWDIITKNLKCHE
jgi:hypothetical protein